MRLAIQNVYHIICLGKTKHFIFIKNVLTFRATEHEVGDKWRVVFTLKDGIKETFWFNKANWERFERGLPHPAPVTALDPEKTVTTFNGTEGNIV